MPLRIRAARRAIADNPRAFPSPSGGCRFGTVKRVHADNPRAFPSTSGRGLRVRGSKCQLPSCACVAVLSRARSRMNPHLSSSPARNAGEEILLGVARNFVKFDSLSGTCLFGAARRVLADNPRAFPSTSLLRSASFGGHAGRGLRVRGSKCQLPSCACVAVLSRAPSRVNPHLSSSPARNAGEEISLGVARHFETAKRVIADNPRAFPSTSGRGLRVRGSELRPSTWSCPTRVSAHSRNRDWRAPAAFDPLILTFSRRAKGLGGWAGVLFDSPRQRRVG